VPALPRYRAAAGWLIHRYVAQAKQARKDIEMWERMFLETQVIMKHEGTLPKRLWRTFKELTEG
jgi:hypothetical protein